MEARQKLEILTRQLLDQKNCPVGDNSPVYALHELFVASTGVDVLDYKISESINVDQVLPQGKALSPFGAAHCLVDPIRTRQFVRGVHASILKAQHRFPGKRINIVYAGCGPYATLVLPLCSIFSADEIGITLLEYHSYSFDAVQQLIRNLELESWFDDCCLTDATTYKFPAEKELHVVVSETMQACLAVEPQVAITLNLATQLVEGGLFVPENITLDLVFGSRKNEHPENLNRGQDFQPIGNAFDLKEAVMHYSKSNSKIFPDSFEPRHIKIENRPSNMDGLYLNTNIQVFEDHWLLAYESGLTSPALLHDFSQNANLEAIDFQYVLGASPKLDMSFTYKQVPFIPL